MDLWGVSLTVEGFQHGERERLRVAGNHGGYFRHQSVNRRIMVEKYKVFGRQLMLKLHKEKRMSMLEDLLDVQF